MFAIRHLECEVKCVDSLTLMHENPLLVRAVSAKPCRRSRAWINNQFYSAKGTFSMRSITSCTTGMKQALIVEVVHPNKWPESSSREWRYIFGRRLVILLDSTRGWFDLIRMQTLAAQSNLTLSITDIDRNSCVCKCLCCLMFSTYSDITHRTISIRSDWQKNRKNYHSKFF